MATLKPEGNDKEGEEIELHPDAWERFGEFVKRIARAGPQHRKGKPMRGKPASSRKGKDED
jgi:hypothetical protein